MSGASGTGKVAFGRLIAGPQLMIPPVADELRRALEPGIAFPRSGKEWKVGELSVRSGKLVGQFGHLNEEDTEFYDDEIPQYRTARLQLAKSGRFALDPETLGLVFQYKTPRVVDTSYLGALRHLLRWRMGADWDAVLVTLSGAFSQWEASISRVTGITFKFDVRHLTEDTGAELFRLLVNTGAETVILRNPNDRGGVNTNAVLIRQALQFVENGGGEARAQGVRFGDEELLRCSWASKIGGEKLSVELPADDDGNIPYDLLLDALPEVADDE